MSQPPSQRKADAVHRVKSCCPFISRQYCEVTANDTAALQYSQLDVLPRILVKCLLLCCLAFPAVPVSKVDVCHKYVKVGFCDHHCYPASSVLCLSPAGHSEQTPDRNQHQGKGESLKLQSAAYQRKLSLPEAQVRRLAQYL